MSETTWDGIIAALRELAVSYQDEADNSFHKQDFSGFLFQQGKVFGVNYAIDEIVEIRKSRREVTA